MCYNNIISHTCSYSAEVVRCVRNLVVLYVYIHARYIISVRACGPHAVGDAPYYGLVRLLARAVNDLYLMFSYIGVTEVHS